MAANTCTSSTGTVTGSDNAFVVTFKTNGGGFNILRLKYTKGTESYITLTIDTLNPSLNAGASLGSSDVYGYVSQTGTVLAASSVTINTSDNLRIPIETTIGEKEIIANITFSSAGQGGAVTANLTED